MSNVEAFLTHEEEQEIISAIRIAEKNTSGEIISDIYGIIMLILAKSNTDNAKNDSIIPMSLFLSSPIKNKTSFMY